MKQPENKQQPSPMPVSLGQYIRQAREARGISLRRLAEEVHMHHGYISRLEADDYHQPSPEKLQRIAAILELNYDDLFAIAGYHAPEGLPSFVPYLRAKYQMTDLDARQLDGYFRRYQRQHGIVERESPRAAEPDDHIDKKLAKDIKATLRDMS